MITMRQLEALNAVIEHRTVTEAARSMHLSQPALSKLISNLEYQTQLTLFRRINRRLVPTDEAMILNDKANSLFDGLKDLSRIALELRNLSAGRMQIACLFALGRRFLPSTLAAFLRDRMNAQVGFHLHNSHIVNSMAVNQQTDLGLSMVALEHPAVESRLLCQVPAVCALPCDHRLCRRERLVARDLQDERFISFGSIAQMRRQIDEVFDSQGVTREMALETYMSESACAMVACGLGLSLVDPLTAHDFVERGELVVRPFEPELLYDFYMLRPRYRPPSQFVDSFIDLLQQDLADFLVEIAGDVAV